MPPKRTLSLPNSPYRFEKHGRFWKVMDRDTLVAVVVYKKGAISVKHRLDLALHNLRVARAAAEHH